MTTATPLHATVRFGSVALVLLTVALASPSQARMKNPELNSLGAACWDLQTQNDKLIAEYKNASNARREELLQQIRNNGRTWRQIGCQGAYGDISMLVLTPGGLRNGITWDMLTQADAAPSQGNNRNAAPGGGAVFY